MKNIFQFKKFDYANWPPSIRRLVNVCLGFHLFGYPYKKLKIIGVTGTNGKTTTSTLLYRIATALGYKAGLIGTVEHIIAGRKIATDFTTPEALQLNKLLSEMAKEGCEYVFMEVSSHGMGERRVAGLKFDGGIFTNLTQDHLDYHKNMENYFSAKRKFFKILPKNAFALANIDDERGFKMLEGIKAAPFTYGFQCQRDTLTENPMSKCLFDMPDFHGKINRLDFNGLNLSFNNIEIRSKLLGKFNAYNLLATWSACSLLGFDMQKVNKILETIEPPRGRFEHFTSKNGVLVIVDYAHTPDALEKIFMAVREVKPENSRIISVFGCGGDRDATKRPKMGDIGAAFSDIAIFTSDNPRSEDPNKIIADMMAPLYPDTLKKVKAIPNRREAIQEAVKLAQKNDVILCAGKGHENYQEIRGIKTPFDDMEELKKTFYML